MTHEEIIKAWFAIEESGGDNIRTELLSYHDPLSRGLRKVYRAYIKFGLGYEFFAHETDMYEAMEKAINKYSEFKIKNEIE